MRTYLSDGYIQAAVIIFVVFLGPAVVRPLDGRPIIAGPYTAALYAVATCLFVSFAAAGIRRVKKGKHRA